MISLPQARVPSLAAFHRTEMAFVRLVRESHRLACGEAHHFAATPTYPGGCLVTDFECEPDQISAALREIDEHYRAIGGRCDRISARPGAPAEEFDAGLRANGFIRKDRSCHARLAAARAVDSSSDQAMLQFRDLKVLPARAMPRAYRKILTEQLEALAESSREIELAMALDRLDDAQFEPWVAMRGDHAVGTAALHSVGDIGGVHCVYVTPEARRSGVGTALLQRISQTAHRWNLETIYFGMSSAVAVMLPFAQKCGFRAIDCIAGWRRD